MAHVRRKFSDAQQNDKTRAECALSMFLQQLYAIERRIKGGELTSEAIFERRLMICNFSKIIILF